jgi:hypothetical protein
MQNLIRQPAATGRLGPNMDFKEVLDKKVVRPAQDCLLTFYFSYSRSQDKELSALFALFSSRYT